MRSVYLRGQALYCLLVPLAAILIPLGFFLSVAKTPKRPNEWIWSLCAGAVVLAISVVVLGVGLIRAPG